MSTQPEKLNMRGRTNEQELEFAGQQIRARKALDSGAKLGHQGQQGAKVAVGMQPH